MVKVSFIPVNLCSARSIVKRAALSFALAGLIPGISAGAEYAGQYYYRFLNDSGETVIATQIPREAAGKGYEVLTDTGRVLKIVDPELSEEARQALSLQQQIEYQKKAKVRQQAQEDEELLRLFASTEDVDRSLERLRDEIDSRIIVLSTNINRLKLQYEHKQAKGAELERSGRKVPDNLIQEMKDIQANQERFAEDIAVFEQEKGKLEADYATRRARVRFLLEGEQVLARNKDLSLSRSDVAGHWEPVKTGSGVITWFAESDGRFVLTRKAERGIEKWRGNWSLSRNNEIVVIYFRKEVSRAGKTSKVSFAKEERYPVMDSKDGDLYVYWDESIVRFHKNG